MAQLSMDFTIIAGPDNASLIPNHSAGLNIASGMDVSKLWVGSITDPSGNSYGRTRPSPDAELLVADFNGLVIW
jgi:hypothetical protein